MNNLLEIPINKSKLNFDVIDFLIKKYDQELKILSTFTHLPYKDVFSKTKFRIHEFERDLNSIYNFKKTKIYRGINLCSGNTMGLIRSFIFKTWKSEAEEGYEFNYFSKIPTSFTFSYDIAHGFSKSLFGKDDGIIIETSLPEKNRIILTDEIMYILSKMDNNSPATQKEVIIYGNEKLRCKIIRKGN